MEQCDSRSLGILEWNVDGNKQGPSEKACLLALWLGRESRGAELNQQFDASSPEGLKGPPLEDSAFDFVNSKLQGKE